MSATKSKIAKTAEKLAKAEQAVKEAKEAHRQAFRRALVDLCNEYGFCLEACGTEGADIEINEMSHGNRVCLEDIPE